MSTCEKELVRLPLISMYGNATMSIISISGGCNALLPTAWKAVLLPTIPSEAVFHKTGQDWSCKQSQAAFHHRWRVVSRYSSMKTESPDYLDFNYPRKMAETDDGDAALHLIQKAANDGGGNFNQALTDQPVRHNDQKPSATSSALELDSPKGCPQGQCKVTACGDACAAPPIRQGQCKVAGSGNDHPPLSSQCKAAAGNEQQASPRVLLLPLARGGVDCTCATSVCLPLHRVDCAPAHPTDQSYSEDNEFPLFPRRSSISLPLKLDPYSAHFREEPTIGLIPDILRSFYSAFHSGGVDRLPGDTVHSPLSTSCSSQSSDGTTSNDSASALFDTHWEGKTDGMNIFNLIQVNGFNHTICRPADGKKYRMSISPVGAEKSFPRGGHRKPHRLYRCKQCAYVARSKDERWLHYRTHIKTHKLLSCPDCPFVTEHKHHLEYHMRNHYGSKPFKCTKCPYSCINKAMLKSHMKSHTDHCEYQCADCDYATKYCHSMNMHARKHSHRPVQREIEKGQQSESIIIDG